MPLNIGISLSTGTTVQRLAAIEQAITTLDSVLKVQVQALIDDGNRTTAALNAAAALGLPTPPPLPSTLP